MGESGPPVPSSLQIPLNVERVTGISPAAPRIGGRGPLGVGGVGGVDEFRDEGGPHLSDSLVTFLTHTHRFSGGIQ